MGNRKAPTPAPAGDKPAPAPSAKKVASRDKLLRDELLQAHLDYASTQRLITFRMLFLDD